MAAPTTRPHVPTLLNNESFHRRLLAERVNAALILGEASFTDLADVGFAAGDAADGNLLEWDATTSKWIISTNVRAASGGVQVNNPGNGGGNPNIELQEVGATRARLFYDVAGNVAIFRGEENSALLDLRSFDSGGVERIILRGNPDGAAVLYHSGVLAAGTIANGMFVQDGGSTSPRIWMRDSSGTDVAFYGVSNAGYIGILSRSHGTPINLRGEDAGGTERLVLSGDPDSKTALYYAGVEALATWEGGGGRGVSINGESSIRLRTYNNERGIPALVSGSTFGSLLESNVSGHMVVGIRGNDSEDGFHVVDQGSVAGQDNNFARHIFSVTYDRGVEAYRNGSFAARFGRMTSQYLGMFGSGEANALWSVSPDDNGKTLDIRADTTTGALTAGNDPRIRFRTRTGVVRMEVYPNGVVIGSPSGGPKGHGTLNAKAVYDDNTLLTDYVFDAELDGRVDVEAWDEKVPNRRRVREPDEAGPGEEIEEIRTHEPARKFGRRAQDDLDPARYAESWRRNRRLPAFDDKHGEQLSLGEYAQRLLETCEVQAVHIEKLRQRLTALEARQPNRREAP